ncbi:RsfA family transcriptional regulator [Pueribacillus theae]|uniref:RsfA family transcriptional regulator n=1 Tax=Pueribacillus theae TaxID=2171751 RepID=A0A2U1K6E8_9BACI|nr:RsfA family transcriptional regulator [Pueribacillus theae]PWA12533.1 RsfA family transcriptional regulator [Pueribacillus theae]
MKVRQDAWSHEDDLLLAETVLRHIREGSTQLVAFDEVGDKLNRTSAAVGFRWNAIVRNKYEQAIQLAKKQRKERKRAQAIKPVRTVSNTFSQAKADKPLDLQDVINYLKELKQDYSSSHKFKDLTETLQTENEQLKKENDRLEKELRTLEQKYSVVQDDYQSLIQIMERARKMVVLQEDVDPGTAFKMDKNGNLEKVAK